VLDLLRGRVCANFGMINNMAEQQNEFTVAVTLTDDDMIVQVTRQTAQLSASHAAQLGKITQELSGQNQQNFQNN
jgi:hypothetical protein